MKDTCCKLGPLTSIDQLAERGLVEVLNIPALQEVGLTFPIRITPETAALIDSKNPTDPIARQYVPSVEELQITPDDLESPTGDDKAEVVKGLLRKYPDRVLIKLVNVCATYCRFCFRRQDIGDGRGLLNEEDFDAIISLIEDDSTIWEVILSGGDPLVLPPAKLHGYLVRLANIEHVRALRIHTRVPIVSPSAVTHELLCSLKINKTVWIALHCNHPKELTPEVRASIKKLVDAGVPLLSQTVLLRGINDDERVLAQLFRDLAELKVKPFQLHHCDLAKRTSHFRLSIERGQEIFRGLSKNLSSLCLPMYMLEIPGGYGKIRAVEAQLSPTAKGEWALIDTNGMSHIYREPK